MTKKIAHYAYPIFWIAVLLGVSHFLGEVLLPLIVSFFLAYLCLPVVKKFQKWGLSETIAVWGTFAITFIVMTAIAFFLVPFFIHRAIIFIFDIPRTLSGLATSFENLAWSWGIEFHIDQNILSALIQKEMKSMSLSTLSALSSILKATLSNIVKTLIAILSFLLFPVLFYHSLAKFERIKKEFKAFVPERHHAFLSTFSVVCDKVLSSYIRGQFLVCSTLAILFALGLWLVHLKYGILIGVMTGYFMVIPYAGFCIGLLTGLCVAFSNGYTLEHTAAVLGVFLIVQCAESFIVTPKIMGNKIGLDPFVTLLAIIIGGHLLGLLGILIAVPTSGVLKHFYGALKTNYQKSEFFLKS